MRQSNIELRERNVQESRRKLAIRDEKEAAMYSLDLSKQAKQLNELKSLSLKHSSSVAAMGMSDLFQEVMKKESRSVARVSKREEKFAVIAARELTRLQDILKADEVGRAAARKFDREQFAQVTLKPLSRK